jgi:MoaA/NifB/PqqE/SkfB family radical SAM enzyme
VDEHGRVTERRRLPLSVTATANRKDESPSASMLPSDGRRYRCAWIEDSVTIHSDGNVSCGLDDPDGRRSFGNLTRQTVTEVFANPEYRRLQERLWAGQRCRDCGHFEPVDEPAAALPPRAVRPTRLVVEPTVVCNIRCPNPPCLANNDPGTRTRDAAMLDPGVLERVVDELAPDLHVVNFYNYGEPFLHRDAPEMLARLRARCPGAQIVTSTNGIPLADPGRAERVVRAAPDHVTFTISGSTQASYERYHVRGRLEQAMAGLRNVCEAKRRLGVDAPAVVWRYLVFHWNDGDDEIDAAIVEADRIGAQLSLYLTATPEGARSIRFSPGSPSYLRYGRFIHRDHLGRLDHAYPGELPDESGLYAVEELPELGRARWTASRAVVAHAADRRLRLAVGTTREPSDGHTTRCRITAPWAQWEVEVPWMAWRDLDVRVPRRHRGAGFDVVVETDDYFCPTELGSVDPRCLGVLLRADE